MVSAKTINGLSVFGIGVSARLQLSDVPTTTPHTRAHPHPWQLQTSNIDGLNLEVPTMQCQVHQKL